jgi:hypothetical protein
VSDADEASEATAILRLRLDALERLSWTEMDAYGESDETVHSPSGRRFRVVTGAFWDMDEWASGMELYAKAYASSGWRRRFPYKLWSSRGGPEDPVPEPPPGWTPERRLGWFCLRRRRRR